ncbi:peptidylprolyl isomerase [Pseudanabaena sp. PCC 6802]|uniref:peptidylprolyl isomerase n=1 Tax=Pseudanabaena sp. PCC 6802 TaxID=118173 RepID=UPI0003490B9B|nr:peptidylprolyl isomerase [Pseudanabaena sp. PCC 6802]
MTETLERNNLDFAQKPTLLEIAPASHAEVIAYLNYSHKIAEFSALAERDILISNICNQLSITASDEELQQAGDAFRQEHKLFSTAETLSWLQQQRITVEDWTQGIRITLLTKKLKEHLFGDSVDSHYLNNRNDYKRVALSQILVVDLTNALQIVQAIQNENASFCAMAIEHSRGKHSKQNGGFAGINFMAEIMPEIKQAIAELKEGEIAGPIQTKLGYHILRIEKWYPAELSDSIRDEVLDSLFMTWLKNISGPNPQVNP